MHDLKAADRRKYHRLATDQLISFTQVDQRDQLGVGKDLSLGGVRFEAIGVEIELGETLEFTFNLGDQTVSAIGRVAWVTDTDPLSQDIGIEFVEVSEPVLALIDEYTGGAAEE